MLRHLPVLGASLAALLLSPAIAAAADTIALEAPAVGVEETAMRIVVRGERMAGRRGARELLLRSVSGEFREALFLPPAGPRRLIACAYLSKAQDVEPDARRSLRTARV